MKPVEIGAQKWHSRRRNTEDTTVPTVGIPGLIRGGVMTHRESFNRRKRRFVMLFLAVLITGVALGWIGVQSDTDWLVMAAYLSVPLLFIVLYTAVMFGFRCPACRGQWGWIAMYSGGPFAIRKQLRWCPYCGVDLDTTDTAGSSGNLQR
jgi:hypothetical protein